MALAQYLQHGKGIKKNVNSMKTKGYENILSTAREHEREPCPGSKSRKLQHSCPESRIVATSPSTGSAVSLPEIRGYLSVGPKILEKAQPRREGPLGGGKLWRRRHQMN